jgi:UDP-N-acetylglucosamine--N-acetylmuramyl-(pentapeptide) pyrophosphoryl-undecaprenol N-acetylglucosamine transferase
VICRAGASTIAELTVAGRPAILVPYPHAMDDHQTANAGEFAKSSGGWMMPQTAFTPATLAERLAALLADPAALATAASAARSFARDDAAERLAGLVQSLANNGNPMERAA